MINPVFEPVSTCVIKALLNMCMKKNDVKNWIKHIFNLCLSLQGYQVNCQVIPSKTSFNRRFVSSFVFSNVINHVKILWF